MLIYRLQINFTLCSCFLDSPKKRIECLKQRIDILKPSTKLLSNIFSRGKTLWYQCWDNHQRLYSNHRHNLLFMFFNSALEINWLFPNGAKITSFILSRKSESKQCINMYRVVKLMKRVK